MSAQAIIPSEIPGEALDPDSVEAEARRLAEIATDVENQGAVIHRSWQGLSAHYEAPESGRLFAVMTPVESRAATFGGNLGGLASALSRYAADIRPIKEALDRVRAQARTFVAGLGNGYVEQTTTHLVSGVATTRTVAWNDVPELREQNNALLAEVRDLVARMWEVERTCASAIYALIGRAPLEAATDANPDGYGVAEIPEDAELPWGSPVGRTENCGTKTAGAVKGFVWDGIVVDGIWGTVQGLGTLALGYNPNTGEWFSGEAYSAGWSSIGMLGVGLASLSPAGFALGALPGPAGDFVRRGQQTLLDTGKGLIARDQWSEDPARAAGASVFNIATIVIPAGAAVTSAKVGGSASAAALRSAARVVDIIDPASLAFRGGAAGVRATLPALGDLGRLFDGSLGQSLSDLGRLDAPRVEVPTVPRDGLSIDAPPATRGNDGGVGTNAGMAPSDAPAPRGTDDAAAATSGGGARDGGVTPREEGAGPDWTPADGDPTLSGRDAGPGWNRVEAHRGEPIDPNYGEVRAEHGTLDSQYVPPERLRDDVRHLVTDPDAPFGRGDDGAPFTREQWESRYMTAEGRPVYPGNDGAVPGRRIDYTDLDQFTRDYGSQLDRLGSVDGSFFSFPEMSFESRALPGSNLNGPYSVLELRGELPPGVRIEVSEVAPAFGQPGGGLQVRFIDDAGNALSQRALSSPELGVLGRIDPASFDALVP